jgi:hypothetical protein
MAQVIVLAEKRDCRTAGRRGAAAIGEVVPDNRSCRRNARQPPPSILRADLNWIAATGAARLNGNIAPAHRARSQRIDGAEGVDLVCPKGHAMAGCGFGKRIGVAHGSRLIAPEQVALPKLLQQSRHRAFRQFAVTADFVNGRRPAKIGVEPKHAPPHTRSSSGVRACSHLSMRPDRAARPARASRAAELCAADQSGRNTPGRISMAAGAVRIATPIRRSTTICGGLSSARSRRF